jgi:hypothetical protein
MAEPIRFPGFPQILVTRGFAYQFLESCGWDRSERGFGSLDYTVFAARPVSEPVTDEAERDFWLDRVRPDYTRNDAPICACINCGQPVLASDDWIWHDLHPTERAPGMARKLFSGELRGISWEPDAPNVPRTAKREHRECLPVVTINRHVQPKAFAEVA